MTAQVHYQEPGRFTRLVFNPIVSGLTKLGLGIAGSQVLRVRGRSSGEWRATPVNVLRVDGIRYLVAPRGETQWVRNLRAADGHGELRSGRRTEAFVATELDPRTSAPVLRAYLKKWQWEVGVFFDGVDADSADAALVTAAHRHPIFELAS